MNGDLDRIRACLPAYEIGGELGRGGWGIVLEGRHRPLRREVAIKQLPPSFAAKPHVRARFAREARLAAQVSHPHIVPIYDYVECDDLCLLVMEKLPLGTVWSRFKSEGFTAETTCALLMATCAGLHCAHQHGVLHRDVKPENLMFSADDILKVTDFGIAKVIGGNETLATPGGDILGTAAYMAPEQALGEELGPPADVYAAGITLYELLSGHLPFSDEGGPLATVYRHVYDEPIPLGQVVPEIPRKLAEVTMTAIARGAGDRHASARDFGLAIGQAAAAEWGPDWLARANAQLMDLTLLPDPGVSQRAPRASPELDRPGVRVRSSRDSHKAPSLVDLEYEDLVPVRHFVPPASKPLVLAVAAVVLVALTLFLAFRVDNSRPTLPGAAPTVAGVDVSDGAVPNIDLTEPIVVRFQGIPSDAAGATEVQLALSRLPLIVSDAEPLRPQGGGLFGASLDVGRGRYLIAGTVTAELRLRGNDSTVRSYRFRVHPAHSALLTIPGVSGLVLLPLVIGYGWSRLRRVAGGRALTRSELPKMAGLGVAFGLLSVVFGWIAGASEPDLTTVLACLTGGAAGVVSVLAVAGAVASRRA